jgi:hypothetical protein
MIPMKTILSPVSVLVCIVASLFVCGCATQQNVKFDTVADATAAITQQKDLAEQWAHKLKGAKASAADLRTGEEKYREAASQNKGYLEAVGQGIIAKKNLETSETYKSLAAKAGNSAKDFVDFAKSKTGAPASPQRFVGAGEIANVLVQAGITIWKEYQAEARAEREAQADRLIKRGRWDDWDKIQ